MPKTELRIKEICKEKGIKLNSLAEHLKIKPASLSQSLSRGNYNIDRLEAIADFLQVHISELFERPSKEIITCPNCGKCFKMME